MSYDRDVAIAYARRFWDRPADDGIFWLTNAPIEVARKRREMGAPESDGWEARFVPDGAGAERAVFRRTVAGVVQQKIIQEWAGLADCAHFLSRCITAGGIRVSELSVPKMIAHLQERADTKTLAERVSQERGQRIINTGLFKKADMLGYFNVSPDGDYGGARQYSHSTMFVGKLNATDDGRITCHTKSRFAGLSSYPDQWFLDSGHYTYTFIHFSTDDKAPDTTVAKALEGWWKHVYGGRTEYYFVFKDGRARYSLSAPKSKTEPLTEPDGSAYWFQEADKITFFWRKTGTVETWRASPGKTGEFATTVNDVQHGVATKL